eukprot:jgi/Bigna1/78467/fgenesh1_pg.55_\
MHECSITQAGSSGRPNQDSGVICSRCTNAFTCGFCTSSPTQTPTVSPSTATPSTAAPVLCECGDLNIEYAVVTKFTQSCSSCTGQNMCLDREASCVSKISHDGNSTSCPSGAIYDCALGNKTHSHSKFLAASTTAVVALTAAATIAVAAGGGSGGGGGLLGVPSADPMISLLFIDYCQFVAYQGMVGFLSTGPVLRSLGVSFSWAAFIIPYFSQSETTNTPRESDPIGSFLILAGVMPSNVLEVMWISIMGVLFVVCLFGITTSLMDIAGNQGEEEEKRKERRRKLTITIFKNAVRLCNLSIGSLSLGAAYELQLGTEMANVGLKILPSMTLVFLAAGMALIIYEVVDRKGRTFEEGLFGYAVWTSIDKVSTRRFCVNSGFNVLCSHYEDEYFYLAIVDLSIRVLIGVLLALLSVNAALMSGLMATIFGFQAAMYTCMTPCVQRWRNRILSVINLSKFFGSAALMVLTTVADENRDGNSSGFADFVRAIIIAAHVVIVIMFLAFVVFYLRSKVCLQTDRESFQNRRSTNMISMNKMKAFHSRDKKERQVVSLEKYDDVKTTTPPPSSSSSSSVHGRSGVIKNHDDNKRDAMRPFERHATSNSTITSAKIAALSQDSHSEHQSSSSIDMRLPDGWSAHRDSEHGQLYFFNLKTGESSWEPPHIQTIPEEEVSIEHIPVTPAPKNMAAAAGWRGKGNNSGGGNKMSPSSDGNQLDQIKEKPSA